MPTRLERLNKYYWNRSDIQIVLGIPQKKASEVFKQADEIEKSANKWKAHETKVSAKTVYSITETDVRLLRKNIESEETQKKSSTLEK
ncbi:MAG: hypothetical protein ACK5L6_13365 [Anaerorhabdus sp.]|uniref:hypothetical protein n=1 Tax=Anaerorhabdus sp. TaxID=1872524 RepID=UPI003A844D2A